MDQKDLETLNGLVSHLFDDGVSTECLQRFLASYGCSKHQLIKVLTGLARIAGTDPVLDLEDFEDLD